MTVSIIYSCADTKNKDGLYGEDFSLGKTFIPVLPNTHVIAFFEEHLPIGSSTRESNLFFGYDNKKNECVIINSMTELRKSTISLLSNLPQIDFKIYTLIIGQHQMPTSGHAVIDQCIIVDSHTLELNLTVNSPHSVWPIVCPMYYWGLYPKLPMKPINVNIDYSDTVFDLRR
jgi:hypothetical protein